MAGSRQSVTRKLLICVHHAFDQWNAPAWFSARLRDEFPQVEVVLLLSDEGVDREIVDSDILVAWSIRPEQIASAKRLRWMHSPAAAVDQLMFPELIHSQIVLTNARHVHGPVVAEHVMALLFALAKKIPAAVRLQDKRIWGQQILWDETPRVREVAGATLGIVGLGSIGRPVVTMAKAVGLKVIAVREHPEQGSEGADSVVPPSATDEVFRLADYLVLAAPVTAATKALANRDRLARMKPEACLINVSRGSLVDEQALADALLAKKLGGAALDVFPQEPLPALSPLWDVPNLLITPHTAALTGKLWERHYAVFAENLRRYCKDEPLQAVVDKHKGY
jgi:phosphoglycerate dehydrogenase-like enzyme